jgi:hypothetical protein
MNIEVLNLLKSPKEGECRKKKIRRDETIGL